MDTSEFKDQIFDIYEDSCGMNEIFGDEIIYSIFKPDCQSHSTSNEVDCDEHSISLDSHRHHNHHQSHNDSTEQTLLMEGVKPSDIWSSAVLNDDPMMSQASQSQSLTTMAKSDHCYSTSSTHTSESASASTLRSQHTYSSKLKLITNRGFQSSSNGRSLTTTLQQIKQEPKIITVHTSNPGADNSRSGRPAQSLLRMNNTSSLGKPVSVNPASAVDRYIYPITRVKREPGLNADDDDVYTNSMPMTPPSSNQSSDSEGGTSPRPTPPTSPIRQVLVARASGYRYNPATAIYSQPIPTSGVLRLTAEEKRTFMTEGYPLPAKLPLTKAEERNLKKVRRKIKNKISAQESRRKKKEYMDQLEKKVDDIVRENGDLKEKCLSYESNNRSLISQLHKLQAVLKRVSPRQVTAQTGTCLMVMVLCFAVFVGNWNPFTSAFSSIGGGGEAYSSLNYNQPLGEDNSYVSTQMRMSRTLSWTAEDVSLYSEPWLVTIARRSLQWTAYLVKSTVNTSIVTESSSYSATPQL